MDIRSYLSRKNHKDHQFWWGLWNGAVVERKRSCQKINFRDGSGLHPGHQHHRRLRAGRIANSGPSSTNKRNGFLPPAPRSKWCDKLLKSSSTVESVRQSYLAFFQRLSHDSMLTLHGQGCDCLKQKVRSVQEMIISQTDVTRSLLTISQTLQLAWRRALLTSQPW